MKRLGALCLALVLAILPEGALGEKVDSFPALFKVQYTMEEREVLNAKGFVSKDHITTALTKVDDEINGLVDQFDEAMSGKMQPASKPRRNSRLDIHVVHTRSGDSCLSFLVMARESYNRKQVRSPIAGCVFDMETGEKVTLADLFEEESEAWDVLAETVYDELSAYYPKDKANEEALRNLCTREELQNTPFMLGPVCLTLHYEASEIYPGRATLMKVTVPYHSLRGMMTEYGQRQTDNGKYKMVALTFDDGPAYETTATLLNNLRQHGAVGTFFLVGNRIEEFADIVMRENDENHSLQSHHYVHTDTSKSTIPRIQAYTERMYNVMTETFGLGPWMLRAPYGVFDYFIKAKVNLPLIEWDVDTKDWTGKTSAAVMSVVKNETKDGSIILMHDIKDNTPESARLAAQWLYDHGYMCVTMEDLFIAQRQEMIPNRIYYRIDPGE